MSGQQIRDRAILPGLDEQVRRYLDEHPITAGDVIGYTIKRQADGETVFTLQCLVPKALLSGPNGKEKVDV